MAAGGAAVKVARAILANAFGHCFLFAPPTVRTPERLKLAALLYGSAVMMALGLALLLSGH